MTVKIRRLDGWVPQPKDSRDYKLRALVEDIKRRPDYPQLLAQAQQPRYLTVPLDQIAIYDQGGTSECVANAAAGVKSDEEYRQWKKLYRFNASALYAECKKRDGIPYEPGTYPRVACGVMLQYGMKLAGCRKQWDPKWAIDSYYAITPDVPDLDIKLVLVAYSSFLTAFGWYDNWMGLFEVFPDPGNVNGGHCINVAGWDDSVGGGGWVARNSWGFLWGQYQKPGLAIMRYGMYREIVLPQSDTWKVLDKV